MASHLFALVETDEIHSVRHTCVAQLTQKQPILMLGNRIAWGCLRVNICCLYIKRLVFFTACQMSQKALTVSFSLLIVA